MYLYEHYFSSDSQKRINSTWQYEFLQVLSIYHLNGFQFHNDRYYLNIKKINKFVCVYM